jgi:hypothetical protein
MATDFNTACIVTLSKMGSNTLTQSFQTDESEIDAREAKLFHFLLGSRSNSGFTDAFVRMTIVNRRGDVVATLDSKPDRPATTLSIYVPEGTYTIRFRAIKPNGSFNGSLTYWLDAEMLSDSVGPYYSGGTSSGGGSGNGGYSYSGSSSSNTNYNRPYYY